MQRADDAVHVVGGLFLWGCAGHTGRHSDRLAIQLCFDQVGPGGGVELNQVPRGREMTRLLQFLNERDMVLSEQTELQGKLQLVNDAGLLKIRVCPHLGPELFRRAIVISCEGQQGCLLRRGKHRGQDLTDGVGAGDRHRVERTVDNEPLELVNNVIEGRGEGIGDEIVLDRLCQRITHFLRRVREQRHEVDRQAFAC